MAKDEIKKGILRARIVREMALHTQKMDNRKALIRVIDSLIKTRTMEGNETAIAEIFEELGYDKKEILKIIMERKLLLQDDRHRSNRTLVVGEDKSRKNINEDVPLAPCFDMEQDGM